MELCIQMDYHARHRIVLQDEDPNVRPVEGEWADYRSLASLVWEGELDGRQVRKTYIAGTEYGLLPKAETVYEIHAVATTLDMSMQYIDAQGVDRSLEDEEDTQVIPSPEVNPAV